MILNIADLVNPETGNTYRQDNMAKKHTIPIGSLVEIVHNPIPGIKDDPEDLLEIGIRLHVVAHTRDCDGTPLYSLGIYGNEGDLCVMGDVTLKAGRFSPRILQTFHGYGEEQLKLIER